MKIFVKTHPHAKKAQVLRKDESHYEIWIHEAPEDGKANRAILERLSEALGVRKSSLSIVSGQTSRNKVVQGREESRSRQGDTLG